MTTPNEFSLIHEPTQSTVASVVRLDHWWAKGVGLMGRRELASGTGVWMSGVASIHTMFMRFPLDLLFLDEMGILIKSVSAVPPWVPLVTCWGAHVTVELAAGTLSDESLVKPGERWFLKAL